MTEGIAISIITLIGTLVGIFVSAKATREDFAKKLEISQAVTNNELKHLTEEVKKHNAFAERIPKLEGEIGILAEKVRAVDHRLDDLERNAS